MESNNEKLIPFGSSGAQINVNRLLAKIDLLILQIKENEKIKEAKNGKS